MQWLNFSVQGKGLDLLELEVNGSDIDWEGKKSSIAGGKQRFQRLISRGKILPTAQSQPINHTSQQPEEAPTHPSKPEQNSTRSN